MSARNLIEKPVAMIVDHIKTNISSALAEVRTTRISNTVSTEPPPLNSYFIYEGAINYQAPGIFVVPQQVSSMLERGQNFISSVAKIIISCVVQDRELELLSKKAWRYQDALHEILHLIELEDEATDPHTKIVIKVIEQRFSENFSTGNSQEKAFRKEVAFDCDVEIYQGL